MMKTEVLNTIHKFNMISPGDKIVAAVSGGADSVALLHLLSQIRHEFPFALSAVHVNHNLRGDESMRDEQFVRELCDKLNVPLDVFSADIKSLSADTKKGIEECARDVRYTLFEKAAGTNGKVATAHTLSDVSETLIFNICRGTGINGLKSIPPVRDNIIRPLIEVSRDEVEKYISDNSLGYVTDSSNLSDDYTRNKIRHNIIPELKKINPSFLSAVRRLTDSAREADACIENQAKQLNAADAAKADIAVLKRYIAMRCKSELGICLQQTHLDAAVKTAKLKNGVCQLPENTFMKVKNGNITFTHNLKDTNDSFCLPFKTGVVETPYKKYKTDIISRAEYENQQKVNKLLFKNALSCDKIYKDTVIRSRKEGDSVRFVNRGCTKTLKKLFCESKILPCNRNSIAVISNGSEILWVEGFGVSEYASVTSADENILVIQPFEGEDYYQ